MTKEEYIIYISLVKHRSFTFSLKHMPQANAISVCHRQISLLLSFIIFGTVCFPLAF